MFDKADLSCYNPPTVQKIYLNMFKRNLLSLFVLTVLFASLVKPVAAQNCTDQYGGKINCTPVDLTINKEVKNSQGNFVENITLTESSFVVGSEITFKITVKNTSGETFTSVKVRDVFPNYLTFLSGPGTYDATNRNLDWEIDSLPAGESKSFEIKAKINNAVTSGITCLTNYAVVSSSARPGGDDDTAQICLGTSQILGATTLPVTGANDLVMFGAFAVLSLTGLALLKK